MDKPIVPPTSTRSLPSYAWWLVLCLVGLDYFSTLAYLPSMAVDKAGRDFAPLTAILVVAITLLVVLPIYLYVVGRSPNGFGVTGLLESHFPGWSGKLFILFLLGFIAADFVITRTLSTADASLHLIHNSYWRDHADWMTRSRESLRAALSVRLQGETANQVLDWWNEQLSVTVILSLLGFGLYFFLLRGFTRGFVVAAGVIVSLFVLLNGMVIVSSILYLVHHPDYLANWKIFQEVSHDQDTAFLVFALAYDTFPYVPPLMLGLGGFELSMASIGLVRGRLDDDPTRPRGRIRNARKLLVAAALLMSLFLLGSVLSVTLLVPTKDIKGGPARNRALAYLAHGGVLQPPGHDPNAERGERPEDLEEGGDVRPANPAKDDEPTTEPAPIGPTAADLNSLFGPAFGTLYDVSTILILFLAGASVTISLRELLPHYLARYGMEMHWARRSGILLHLFNLIILVVIVYFDADVSHQQGAYSTSVLVLLASAALAALVDIRVRRRRSSWLPLVTVPLLLVCVFFICMIVLPIPCALPSWLEFDNPLSNLLNSVVFSSRQPGLVWQSPAGAVIALMFVALIFVMAGVSRWWRSTELRYSGFRFNDDHSAARWEEIRQLEFQVLVPHRPDHRTLAEKDAEIRARHRLTAEVPIIFIEAELGDPSDFHNEPLMRIVKENGLEVIHVSRCASIAHVLAAIALEFSTVGRPPEIHFAWSQESPLASNLHFLLWGEGNIPWMVHALIRKTETEPARRPRIVVG